MNQARTIVEKVWGAHVVAENPGAPTLLYIDLHLVHEVTSPQAFDGLRRRGLKVRRPEHTLATTDHNVPTTGRGLPIANETSARQIAQLERNCEEFGVTCYGLTSQRQGIVHVIGPELGLTQPGMTIVCGDSHTATHGALRPGVTAKDVILALIAKIGTGGATGCVFEYRGSTIRALSMEERMTVTNMSIEAGARAGLVAPDSVTFEYMFGRPYAPHGADWDRAISRWRQLASDEGASYDKQVEIDADRLEPMITFGTSPGMGIPITGAIPDPNAIADPMERESVRKALRYMDLEGGKPLLGHPVNVVFVGSCTNGRLADLRQAASVLKGRKVSPHVRTLIVPGSYEVKRLAEAEGLDQIFSAAGAEWREAGCSMCLAMNEDRLEPGEYCVSTSNRNFEGRQGPGGRTFLASPLTAAACAVTGVVTDVRTML